MTLLLVALAHAVPTCVQASTECALPVGPCLFVQSASDPACVNWDVDSGAIVVMPGSTLDVTLQQNTFLETLHVGVEREQLPEAVALAQKPADPVLRVEQLLEAEDPDHQRDRGVSVADGGIGQPPEEDEDAALGAEQRVDGAEHVVEHEADVANVGIELGSAH